MVVILNQMFYFKSCLAVWCLSKDGNCGLFFRGFSRCEWSVRPPSKSGDSITVSEANIGLDKWNWLWRKMMEGMWSIWWICGRLGLLHRSQESQFLVALSSLKTASPRSWLILIEFWYLTLALVPGSKTIPFSCRKGINGNLFGLLSP